MGVLLFIVAITLDIILSIPGLIADVAECFEGHRPGTGWRNVNTRFRDLAFKIDVFGNVKYGPLFNRLLIRRKVSPHLFGKDGETISLVLGYNLQAGTLRRAGRWLVTFLDWWDPGHCLNTVEAYEKRKAGATTPA